jgi:uncharacterized pyridoxamine 5'-phosphate oxidase family protein
MGTILEKEILSNIRDINHVTFATVEGRQPRLRTMTLMRYEDCYFVATKRSSSKVSQLVDNSLVEWILPLRDEENNGYVRTECNSVFVTDKELRKKLFDKFDFIPKLWESPEDFELVIIQLVPSRYEYLKPGDWEPVFLSLYD